MAETLTKEDLARIAAHEREERDQARARQRAERRAFLRRRFSEDPPRLLVEAGVGPRFLNARVYDLPDDAGLSALVGYMKTLEQRLDEGSNLVVCGPVGVGKTHAGAALVAASLCIGREARIAALPSLTDWIKGRIAEGGGSVSASLERYLAADLIVLDEVGNWRLSDFDREVVFRLVDGRWQLRHSTVVFSNLSPPELADLLGPPIFDRLVDGGAVVGFPGKSRRAPA